MRNAERGMRNALACRSGRTRAVVVLLGMVLVLPWVAAAQYDLLLKGGHVLDPRNRINAPMDVAIAGGKIARVAPNIPPEQAKKVVAVPGYFVTPGLVDIHVHYYAVGSPLSIMPDNSALQSGVTTAVDAGSSGCKNFDDFNQTTIRRARTRVLAFLNIVSTGMAVAANEQDPDFMDIGCVVDVMKRYPEIIVGVKTAHYWTREPFDNKHQPWDAVDRGRQAAEAVGKPMMVDFAGRDGRPYPDLLRDHLRPGDIHTHVLGRGFNPVVDYDTGKVYSYMFEAQKRGIFFDVGHGAGSFWFRTAVPALRNGFVPDSISTDLHTGSVNGPVMDMAGVMSKLLNLGLSLEEVIRRSTVNPAQEIRRPEFGHLSVGAGADVAVLELRKGSFGFWDCGRGKITGTQKLEAVMTLRGGAIVWDREGLSMEDWRKLPKMY